MAEDREYQPRLMIEQDANPKIQLDVEDDQRKQPRTIPDTTVDQRH